MNRSGSSDDLELETELRTTLHRKAALISGPPPAIGEVELRTLDWTDPTAHHGRPNRSSVRRWVAVAACLAVTVGIAVVIRSGGGTARRDVVRAGTAPAATTRFAPDLPAWFDPATARPIFSITAPSEEAATRYLQQRLGNPDRQHRFVVEPTIDGIIELRWRASRPESCGTLDEPTCERAAASKGRIYLRYQGGESAIIASVAEGVSLADVTFDGSVVTGSVTAPMPPGEMGNLSADVGEVADVGAFGRAGGAVGSPGWVNDPDHFPDNVKAPGEAVRLEFRTVRPEQRAAVVRVEQRGGGRSLGVSEIRLDRAGLGPPSPAPRTLPFHTELAVFVGPGRSRALDVARQRLGQRGYEVYPPHVIDQRIDETIVLYRPGKEPEAREVAKALGLSGSAIAPLAGSRYGDVRTTDIVVVALGAGYGS